MKSLILSCIGFLLATGAFNTLLRALRLSAEGGLQRLSEHHPGMASTLKNRERRWPELLATLTLIAGSFQIANIWTSVLIFQHPGFPEAGWASPVFVMGYILLNVSVTRSLPTILSEHFADRITLLFLPLCGVLTWIFFPLAFAFTFAEKHLIHRLQDKHQEGNRPSAEDEILTLVEQTRDTELEEEERDFIRSALEFSETITREIMTPRVRMTGLEDTHTVASALKEVQDSPYSRFPLFHDDYDEILGMLHVKDILRAVAREELEAPVTSLMKAATFVPESMPIKDLLQQMKQQKVHTAIAVDEYGGTAGVVTLEDILEELVGEIEDEHDPEERTWRQLAPDQFELEATMPLDEVNEELGLELPEGEDYDSIGGYILQRLGRIPRSGERLAAPGCEIRIQQAISRRIQKLIIRKLPLLEED